MGPTAVHSHIVLIVFKGQILKFETSEVKDGDYLECFATSKAAAAKKSAMQNAPPVASGSGSSSSAACSPIHCLSIPTPAGRRCRRGSQEEGREGQEAERGAFQEDCPPRRASGCLQQQVSHPSSSIAGSLTPTPCPGSGLVLAPPRYQSTTTTTKMVPLRQILLVGGLLPRRGRQTLWA
ncbi:hypothetical protein PG996_016095 [Apiospora saccharicola]|uniref:Uncharacterized protein n=1 Tax=Apiospora saccharicola TaxID=335842 RepID=A0ABR1TN03_9PEZI